MANTMNIIMIIILGYIGWKYLLPKLEGGGGGGDEKEESSSKSSTNTNTIKQSNTKSSGSNMNVTKNVKGVGNVTMKGGEIMIDGKELDDYINDRTKGRVQFCINGKCESRYGGVVESSPAFANIL